MIPDTAICVAIKASILPAALSFSLLGLPNESYWTRTFLMHWRSTGHPSCLIWGCLVPAERIMVFNFWSGGDMNARVWGCP